VVLYFLNFKYVFEINVPLKQISYYKIGGKAKYFFEAKDVDGLIKAVLKARKIKAPIFVLAGGTNVLISEEGFNGLIIKNSIRQPGDFGAGMLMADLVDYAVDKNFSGLEWAGGLPGTLGGAIRGNAGAFGKEIKDIIDEVVSLDIFSKNPKIIRRKIKDCGFEYRSSIFKKKKGVEIILEASLKLIKDDKKEIEARTKQNINYRLRNHPMEYPSLGSTFKNVPLTLINADNKLIYADIKKGKIPIKNDPFPVVPVAYLISEAGLKGISCGGAMISPKHPNFIVNVLNATADDVKNLIQLAKKEVKKKFGVEIFEEIEYLN